METLVMLAPLVIVGLWAVLTPLAGPALERVPAGWQRAVALVGVALALIAASSLLWLPELAVGSTRLADALVVDRLALALDLLVLVAMAAIVASDPPTPGAAARHGLVLLAGLGAMACAHAGDLTVLTAGLELACLATATLLWLARDRGGVPALTWFMGQGLAAGLLWLGLGLIYGATGTTRLGELVGRVSAVFLRWGASNVQAAVDLLQSSARFDDSLLVYSRDAAVTGAAPAMLLIPGLCLALAGVLARLGVWPLAPGLSAVSQRTGASGVAAALVLVRIAAAAVMLRLFVAVLHAPRLVYAPYGWGTAAALLGGLGAVLGALAAIRASGLRALLAWATVANAGLVLLGMGAAADFYAHAGARSGGLKISDHVDWGQGAGDLAVAAVLLTLAMHALAALGLLVAHAALDRGRGLVDLAGLARRAPVSAAAIAVCLLGLAGAPPTGAFLARLALLQAGLQDSNLLVRVALASGTLAGVALTLGCFRVLATMWSDAPLETPPAGRGWARGTLLVLALLLLGTGLFGQVTVEAAQGAAAGAGLGPGTPARRAWVDARQAR